MNPLPLAAAALNQTPLDWDGNRDRILAAIAQARASGVAWLCLPELCVTGYGCEDAFHAAGTWRTALDVLEEVRPATADMLVCVGLPLLHEGAVYNVAAVLANAQLVGFVAKQHLAGDGLHYEPRWFKAWPRDGVAAHTLEDGTTVPIGDLVLNVGGVKLGFEICEDAWVADRPGAGMAGQAVDVIFNPSASHFAFGKGAVREGFVENGSRAFGVAYVYSNLLGNEAGRAVYDGHTMVAVNGRLLAQGPRLSYDETVVTPALIDIDTLRSDRTRRASYQPDVTQGLGEVDVPALPVPTKPLKASTPDADEQWPFIETVKEESFTRVIALALFDYARKSRSRGFVVSLSGGADSAAVVCLVREAVERSVAAMGGAAAAARLGLDVKDDEDAVDTMCKRLLTTAYQATRNSGEVTRNAARAVAQACGATHHELDVDALVEEYKAQVSAAIGRPLTWEEDDITLQNIQARVRSPSIWMFANIENKLLLSTSNRSEAAVGYATMDGDTSGGLSPIAGIDKAFLREWLKWMETTGPLGGRPIPALSQINRQQPTAELRPSSENQTDEGDLMPYPLLDAIEELAIGRKQSPMAVYDAMRERFSDITLDDLLVYHERFYRLWSRNQWKRERYAPAFHVDDRNLDPRTWCRWPILSGGFARELTALRAHVKTLNA
ncbi:MAG: NAD(+) synthase [Algisphaera sp.]